MSETQKVCIYVDAFGTQDMEWDMPVSVYQLYSNQNYIPEISAGSKRYRVCFSIPKHLSDIGIDVNNVAVTEVVSE